MKKLLSVIVPTYNMAPLLPGCLDSLVVSGTLPKLDVIIVNDGSTDDSLQIAASYAEENPESIRIIDKENGNYGSTINAALQSAEGEYVKILDADDRFEPKELAKYVGELENLEGKADICVTHFLTIRPDGVIETVKYDNFGREPYEYGKIYDLDKVLSDGYIRYFLMHSLTYRTEMLKAVGYRQTEGISYTDMEWNTYPMFQAKTIVFFNCTVYRYTLGRPGQTMDPEVLRKSLAQLKKMTFAMMNHFHQFPKESLSTARLNWLKKHYRNRARVMVKGYLMDIPRRDFIPEEFERIDNELSARLEELGIERIKLYPANKIIRTDAYRYWRKHHDRLPVWVERVNGFLNKATEKVFISLFH